MTSTEQGRPEVFRSVPAVLMSWIWVLIAALNLVDLAVRGDDHLALLAAALILASVGVVYVLFLRPRVRVEPGGLRVVNPLRTAYVPWAALDSVDVTDVLRVRTDDGRTIRAWALRERMRSRRPRPGARPTVPAAAERRIAEAAAQGRAAGAGDAATAVSWSVPALAALGGPVLALLVVLALG
ncbi:PH domain-containing protein [Allonocardiopsis opalescens]|uniref:PH (Pleckstrin Homology) domain-containing protein n=1 Tax=Allonocardiopsis opalescens TaxID=1144618 RepID=A0A2T0PSH2_9ACTN|nr:PH domain-containing protein [Allonocardiopsis opalescens]PRX91835.1 PH (Pleckstrin Homology) domain-containing protein [Allonocardiopsis opalescens]